jgi:uncharacterized protein with NRDE domain
MTVYQMMQKLMEFPSDAKLEFQVDVESNVRMCSDIYVNGKHYPHDEDVVVRINNVYDCTNLVPDVQRNAVEVCIR